MAVTLVRTEHLGGTAFELFFEIVNAGENNPVEGQIFDVHGLAQMKLFIQNVDRYTKVILSVMKHEFTMLLKVDMNVLHKDPKYVYDFACSETWSKHETIKLSYATKIMFNIEVIITVASSKSVLDQMYLDEDFTDFQLSTIEGSIPVHRACLAAHSDVFKRMLCGEWKEAAAGRVELQGVTLQTLKDLKRYMYLGVLPENGLCSLLFIAAYYLIDHLKVECIIKIAHSVTAENLYEFLEASYASNIPDLTFCILNTVRAQPRDVILAAQRAMVKPKEKNKNVIEDKNEIALKPLNNEVALKPINNE